MVKYVDLKVLNRVARQRDEREAQEDEEAAHCAHFEALRPRSAAQRKPSPAVV